MATDAGIANVLWTITHICNPIHCFCCKRTIRVRRQNVERQRHAVMRDRGTHTIRLCNYARKPHAVITQRCDDGGIHTHVRSNADNYPRMVVSKIIYARMVTTTSHRTIVDVCGHTSASRILADGDGRNMTRRMHASVCHGDTVQAAYLRIGDMQH